jgi:lipopolysaccharide export system protein LptA
MRNKLIVLLTVLSMSVLTAEEPKKAPLDEVKKKEMGETVITSKKLVYDYKRRIAVFDGDVVAADPEIKMQAETMTVWFDETNTLKRAMAKGEVKAVYQDKTATGQIVVYDASKGRLEITGNATLVRGKDSIKGDKITVWLNEDKMEVEPNAHMVVYPQSKDSGGGGLKDLMPSKKNE